MSDDIIITIESSFSHFATSSTAKVEITPVPVAESRLMQVIGESVVTATGGRDGQLRLSFSNGHLLVIYDDSKIYESYRIFIDNTEIII